MSLNSLASSRNTSAVRIQEALSLLVPFHELPETEQMRIRHLKSQFPYDDQLIEHLKDVDLMQLVEYLAWIPFQNFVNVEHVGQGGFSTVMKGTIKSYKARSGYIHDAVFALKTIDKFMVGEAVLSTVITLRNSTQDFVSTIGLSRQKGSDNYLIVMDFETGGSLEEKFNTAPQTSLWGDIYNVAYSISTNLSHWIDTSRSPPWQYYFWEIRFDIGLAKVVTEFGNDNNDNPDGCYGRLPYLPPESFSGAPYTMSSDVYCLGTILWQLVSNIPPRGIAGALFREDGLREDPVPGTPKEYQDIINECWRIDPTKRPTASIISRRLFQAKVELDWFRRYNIPSFIIRSFLSSGKLSRKTKTHVEKRVADHQQDLDSDNSNFSLFTAPVSSVTLQELRKPKLISDTAKPFALGNVGWSGDGSSQ